MSLQSCRCWRLWWRARVRNRAQCPARESPHLGTCHLHGPDFIKQRELRERAEQMPPDRPMTTVRPRPCQSRGVSPSSPTLMCSTAEWTLHQPGQEIRHLLPLSIRCSSSHRERECLKVRSRVRPQVPHPLLPPPRPTSTYHSPLPPPGRSLYS